MTTETQIKKIDTLIKCKVPYIWVVTQEEQRIVNLLNERLFMQKEKEIYEWSCYSGLRPINNENQVDAATVSLDDALMEILNKKTGAKGGVFYLKDPHPYISPPVARQIKDLHSLLQRGLNQELMNTKFDNKTRGPDKTVIFISSFVGYNTGGIQSGLEPSIKDYIEIVEFDLPSHKEITNTLTVMTDRLKHHKQKKWQQLSYNNDHIEEFARNLSGLTTSAIQLSIAESLTEKNKIDSKSLHTKKKQNIRNSGIIELIEANNSANDVGGLDSLKTYIEECKNMFSVSAREFGVEAIRGIVLIGPPGTGKSLTCKCVANSWNLPLIRMDVGKIMQGVVGASEANMREAIKVIKSSAPSILWLDEMEKQMSGTSNNGFSDGGTLSRVFGTLLTAMEEELKDVVILATCNDISALPPELIRRFDEVFFVDMPQEKERQDIFKIHFNKRNKKVSTSVIKQVAEMTHDFTGSEIEKIVKLSIIKAFNANSSEVAADHIIEAIAETKPISKLMGEKINRLRDWAKDRARMASSTTKENKKSSSIGIEDTLDHIGDNNYDNSPN